MKRPQSFTSKTNHFILLFFLISLLLHGLMISWFCWSSFQQKNRSPLFSKKQDNQPVIFFDAPPPKEEPKPIPKEISPLEETKIIPDERKEEAIQEQKQVPEEIKRDNETPAQLRAPLSNFGWQFEQEEQTTAVEIPENEDGAIEVDNNIQIDAQELQAAAALDEATAEKPPNDPLPNDQPKDLSSETLVTQDPKPIELKQLDEAPTLATIFDEKLIDPEPATEKKIVEKKPAPKRKPFRMHDVAAPHILLSEKKSQHKADVNPEFIGGKDGIKVRGARKEKPDTSLEEPKKNIIALTKGFIEKHWGEAGTDLVDRDGDPNKHPSLAELKYISYNSKVIWSLQSAWKQNFMHTSPSFQIYFVTLGLIIDEKGFISDAKILVPSGSDTLDSEVIRTAHLAAPFPPLPKHFETTNYPFNVRIEIRN